MTPTDWLLSGDTGTSSETILSVMVGSTMRRHGVPNDPDDFGRCYRLLALFPQWRHRLPEVAKRFPTWGPLVKAWDELSALYERFCEPGGAYTVQSYEANKPAVKALYDRMRVLIDEGRIADGWKQTGPGSWKKGSDFSISLGDATISSSDD